MLCNIREAGIRLKLQFEGFNELNFSRLAKTPAIRAQREHLSNYFDKLSREVILLFNIFRIFHYASIKYLKRRSIIG